MQLHHRYDSESKKVQAFQMVYDKGELKRHVVAKADADLTLKDHRCGGRIAVVPGLPAGIRWAVCAKCGREADRNQRVSPIVDGNIIGGPEAFEPRCEACWQPPPEPHIG